MLLRRFTNYLLTHRWIALLLTLVISSIPVLSITGIIIAGLITLTKGAVEGAIFTSAATIPYFFVLFGANNAVDMHNVQMMLWGAIGVAVSSNFLTWVFAVMLKRRTSWSIILQIAALIGVLIISILHLVYPDIATWWGDQLQASFKHAQEIKRTIGTSTGNLEVQLEAIGKIKYAASGYMAAAFLLNAIIQLIVSRWWQTFLYKPATLRRELHNIRLSHLAGVLFILSIGLSNWDNKVIIDVMPIIYTLFTAAGLSVIHYAFGMLQTPYVWFWLTLVYVTLVLLFPVSIFLLTTIALLDIWLDIRKRFRRF